jgi:hypothetical protein
MSDPFTTAELVAYLDEGLPAERMSLVEQALREDAELAQRLARILAERDAGIHTLGGIWQRNRLSCPTREQLGSYLLEILDPAHADYIRFHLDTIGCRPCSASLADLRAQHAADDASAQESRRRKYFQSSAGYLSSSG